jgi:hypothetical protein
VGWAKDIAEHENRKTKARILDGEWGLEVTRTGWDVSHGFRQGMDARGARLGCRVLVGSGARALSGTSLRRVGETGI